MIEKTNLLEVTENMIRNSGHKTSDVVEVVQGGPERHYTISWERFADRADVMAAPNKVVEYLNVSFSDGSRLIRHPSGWEFVENKGRQNKRTVPSMLLYTPATDVGAMTNAVSEILMGNGFNKVTGEIDDMNAEIHAVKGSGDRYHRVTVTIEVLPKQLLIRRNTTFEEVRVGFLYEETSAWDSVLEGCITFRTVENHTSVPEGDEGVVEIKDRIENYLKDVGIEWFAYDPGDSYEFTIERKKAEKPDGNQEKDSQTQ